MTPLLDRIRAYGGEAIRDRWTLKLRRGRLNDAALAWLREPQNKRRLMREVWPEFDEWEERAAIREFDGGMARAEAEAAAYEEVMAKREGDYAQLHAA
jgi:hypothetical protein